ncbi:hypothetical protein P280DRAFT_544650 [Massarina eburnea CBS 473.64]|uniref:Uncharacterized protein n=1 Tax=Massarina eburnea CBS 473.64 TaxID=1395130 RepID=A0A6A6SG36_9PLEO|nr:hypothetical protein P280DRAFT_544650 [Massarina eburnea CBS 473.64]
MSSPKKSTPASNTPSTPPRSALRPFSLRRSSDLATVNADLQRQLEDLKTKLERKTVEVEAAQIRAQQAEHRETKIKELARKFWKEEWSGMKEYVGLFNSEDEDVGKDLKEIEEQILKEYRELFLEKEQG